MQKLKFHPFHQLQILQDSEEQKKLLDVMKAKHSLYLDNECFEIKTGFYKEQIQIEICLTKVDRSIVYPIEVICVYEDFPHLKLNEIFHVILDYIDLYWAEYFNHERNLFVPLDWSQYECEGLTFFLRGFIRNLVLEKQADSFLREYGYGEHEITSISAET